MGHPGGKKRNPFFLMIIILALPFIFKTAIAVFALLFGLGAIMRGKPSKMIFATLLFVASVNAIAKIDQFTNIYYNIILALGAFAGLMIFMQSLKKDEYQDEPRHRNKQAYVKKVQYY